jgi:hypothetical protein
LEEIFKKGVERLKKEDHVAGRRTRVDETAIAKRKKLFIKWNE